MNSCSASGGLGSRMGTGSRSCTGWATQPPHSRRKMPEGKWGTADLWECWGGSHACPHGKTAQGGICESLCGHEGWRRGLGQQQLAVTAEESGPLLYLAQRGAALPNATMQDSTVMAVTMYNIAAHPHSCVACAMPPRALCLMTIVPGFYFELFYSKHVHLFR